MRSRWPLFMDAGDVELLVANNGRSRTASRTFLPYGEEYPELEYRLESLRRRGTLDADVAVALRTADSVVAGAVVAWRAVRALLRPLFRERPLVVRDAKPSRTKDISEAA
jgi:hypothetical protein